MPVFLLLFIGVPLLEIYLFAHVGEAIGAFSTVALVIITAVLGVWMLRLQGMMTWMKVQQSMAQGQPPAVEMIEGLILLVCGALLLTPGFFTDALGFIMLIPALRRRVAMAMLARGVAQGFKGGMGGSRGPTGFHPDDPIEGESTRVHQPQKNNILEGEYRREDD